MSAALPLGRRHRLPSLVRRALGGLVDIGIGLAISVVMWRLGVMHWDRWFERTDALLWIEATAVRFHRTPGAMLGDVFVAWVPVVLWHAFVGALWQRTPGMWVAGVVAVDASGARADGLHMLMRGMAYMTWPLSGFLVPLWIPASRSQRGVHDLIARTWLVKA